MWVYPKIVAHRGGGSLAPENTLAAMRCGLSYGFRAVEFDVMLSKDGVPIVVHDTQLGRTIAGVGNIADFTAHQLTAMDAGSWFAAEFAGERVPAYEQVFDFCRRNHIWMNVEIKPTAGFDEQTGRVVAQLTRQLMAVEIPAHAKGVSDALPPLLSSFSFESLLAAKAAAPDFPRAYLVDTIPSDWQQCLARIDAVALHTNQKNLSQAQAHAVKHAGYGLFCYTVNQPLRARELFSWGVDGFCTDRIDLIGPQFT